VSFLASSSIGIGTDTGGELFASSLSSVFFCFFFFSLLFFFSNSGSVLEPKVIKALSCTTSVS
jgi:hypothetical protein